MKTPSDGWDRDEREVFEGNGLGREFEAVRARHALRPDDEARLLGRILSQARQSKAQPGRFWGWGFGLAAAAVLLVVGTTWMFGRGDSASEGIKPESTVAVAAPSPAFYLALEKPDLKVSPSALAWRGPSAENRLLADLKPAFDAFRSNDFAAADREFSALSAKYPASIEVWFYQGVARLLVNDVQGAIASLATAERLADTSFAGDVAWYRAIADERAGSLAAARARLTALCAQPGARATPACEALKQLPPR